MAERWAYCEVCAKWFCCSHDRWCTLQLVCPGCGGVPTLVLDGDPTRV